MHTATLPETVLPAIPPPRPCHETAPRRAVRRLADPVLSVVVVNYRQTGNTVRLLRQLRRSNSFHRGTSEVVIVDNHSPRHPWLAKLRRLDGVSFRRWGRNRGFARAVNEGVRLSRGEWALLLNPDVSVPHGFLDSALSLASRLERDRPRVGIIGLGLDNSDGSCQASTGPLPTFFGTLARLLLPRSWRKYSLGAPAAGRVDWVTGCGLLVRRRVLEEVGGLDESFFLYYEDVDLCRRARELGWEVIHEPALRLTHHHPLQTRPVKPVLRLLTRHSLLTYASKHWAGWQSRLLSWLVQGEAWLKRQIAVWRGDRGTEQVFRQLGRIASDLREGRSDRARRRLEQVVRD